MRLDFIKIKKKTRTRNTRGRILAMYGTVSKNYETSFDIVTRSGLTDLDFDRFTVKGSSCVGERMRTSLNQLLN